MPTYEYECNACGHTFDLFQSITAPVKRKCPKCGKSKLERLIGIGAGIIFKGGGFYQTDYRSEGYRKAAEAETKAADGKQPDGEKKTDAAPLPSKTEKPAKAANKPSDAPTNSDGSLKSSKSGGRSARAKRAAP